MTRTVFVVVAIVTYHIFVAYSSNVKFEVILDNATECHKPVPPYAKKRTIMTSFTMMRHNKRTTVSGKYRVLAEFQFKNFSVATFTVDGSGNCQLKAQLTKLNCRSWFGQIFLATTDFHYSKKDCRVEKGTYWFKDFDINKTFHTIPFWHAAGTRLYRSQIVHNGSTVFCIDTMTTILELE